MCEKDQDIVGRILQTGAGRPEVREKLKQFEVLETKGLEAGRRKAEQITPAPAPAPR
jgi:hypothetical protein